MTATSKPRAVSGGGGKKKGKGVNFASPASLASQALKIATAPQRAVDRVVWSPVREGLQALDPGRFGGTASLSEALGLSGNEKSGLGAIFDSAQASGSPLFGGNQIARIAVELANGIATDPVSGVAKLGVGSVRIAPAVLKGEMGIAAAADAEKVASATKTAKALRAIGFDAGTTYRKGLTSAQRALEGVPEAGLAERVATQTVFKSGANLSDEAKTALGYSSRLTWGHGENVITIPGTEKLGDLISRVGGKPSEWWALKTADRNIAALNGEKVREIGRIKPFLRGQALLSMIEDKPGATTQALHAITANRQMSGVVTRFANAGLDTFTARLKPEGKAFSRTRLAKLEHAGGGFLLDDAGALLADGTHPVAVAAQEAKAAVLAGLHLEGVPADLIENFGQTWDRKLQRFATEATSKEARGGGKDMYHLISSLSKDGGTIAGWHRAGLTLEARAVAGGQSVRMIGEVEGALRQLDVEKGVVEKGAAAAEAGRTRVGKVVDELGAGRELTPGRVDRVASALFSDVRTVAGPDPVTGLPFPDAATAAARELLTPLDGPAAPEFQKLSARTAKEIEEKDAAILASRAGRNEAADAAERAGELARAKMIELGDHRTTTPVFDRIFKDVAKIRIADSLPKAGGGATTDVAAAERELAALRSQLKDGNALDKQITAQAKNAVGTPEQKQALKDLQTAHRQEMKRLREEVIPAAEQKTKTGAAAVTADEVKALKAERLAELNNVIKGGNAKTRQLTKELTDAHKAFTTGTGKVAAKDAEILSLSAQRAELEQRMVAYQAGLADRERKVASGLGALHDFSDTVYQGAMDAVGAHELSVKAMADKLGVQILTGPDADASYFKAFAAMEKQTLKEFGNQFMADPHLAYLFNPNTDGKEVGKLTQLWKAYAILRPGFSNRNFIGAYINNKAFGVQLKDYRQAAELLAILKSGGELPAWAEKMGFALASEQLVRSGMLNDITQGAAIFGKGGLRAEELGAAFDRNSIPKLVALMAGRPGAGRVGYGVASLTGVEDNVRLAQFIRLSKQEVPFDRAIETVFGTHFDYSDLSKLDKEIRHYVPFWTYRSRSLPLQAQLFMSNPHLSRSLWLTREQNKAEGRNGDNLPPWLAGLTLPWGDKVVDLNNYLPGSDIVALGDAISRLPRQPDQIGDIASSFLGGPGISAAEVIFNKQLFSGKPIRERGTSAPDQWGQLTRYLASRVGTAQDVGITLPRILANLAPGGGPAGDASRMLPEWMALIPKTKEFQPQ